MKSPTKISDFIAIKIFLLAGAVMAMVGNLAMCFLGLEVLSLLCMYSLK
jgi:NADH-quinone oxidoreductase subunit N